MNDISFDKKNLVFAHKIISHLGMDDLTYTHLSSRINDFDLENSWNFLLSPFGKCFSDVSEDNLLEFSSNLKIKKQFKNRKFNPTGVMIHSSIYKARKNVNSIIHLHTEATCAVSALKDGLLPISQHALHFFDHISYHEYDSLILSDDQQAELLIKDLGQKNNVIFLRNHGFITMGKTIWEALFYAYHLERACKIQISLSGVHKNDLVFPSIEVCKKAFSDLTSFESDLGLRDWEAWRQKLNF
jgi:ribulose-5-phosphate 4-epimerase/fuculose-1-phosphate aldolase